MSLRRSREKRRDWTPGDDAPLLMAHPSEVSELAAINEPFYYSDLEICDESIFRRFRAANIIIHADDAPETGYSEQGFRVGRWRWETPDGFADWADAKISEPLRTCPADDCVAAGIRNLGDGEFTCSDDTCESRFGRSVAEAILDG